jgi:hypothetical protein
MNDHKVKELLDEESLAVLGIMLAVSLEFGFGFAKTVAWWAGLIAGPSALFALVCLFRTRRSRVWLVRVAGWVVRPKPTGEPATSSAPSNEPARASATDRREHHRSAESAR